MAYQDFLVDFVGAPEGGVLARVIGSPAGDGASVLFEMPPIESELEAFAEAAEARVRAERVGERKEAIERLSAQSLRALGVELFDRLIAGDVKSLYDESVGRLAGSGDGLRIKLRLQLQDRDLAVLHGLPWELLTRLDRDQPLGLDRRFSIVRYVPQARNANPPLPERLRILVASAEPRGCDLLNLEQEIDGIRKAFSADRTIEIVPLGQVNLGKLRRALVESEFHVLHFLGHGEYDPESGEGVLFFEDGRRGAEIVRGRHLAEQLLDRSSLRLAFLNACRTARASAPQAFGGVATALVRAGLPAVIAMQFPITDRAAITFSETVYRHLAAGDEIDAAVTEGRLAIVGREPKSVEWGTPALFLHVADGRLFDSEARQHLEEPSSLPLPLPPAQRKSARASLWAAGLVVAVGLGIATWQFPFGSEQLPIDRQDDGSSSAAISVAQRGSSPPPDAEPKPEASTHQGIETTVRTSPGGTSTPRRPDEANPIQPKLEPIVLEPKTYALSSGSSAYVAEVNASVTADFLTEDGVGFVRVVIDPDDGERIQQPIYGPSRIEFESGGRKARVSILSMDAVAQRLEIRGQIPSG